MWYFFFIKKSFSYLMQTYYCLFTLISMRNIVVFVFSFDQMNEEFWLLSLIMLFYYLMKCQLHYWNLKIDIYSVFQALGPGFSQFAEPVFQRCINIIQTQLMAKVTYLAFASNLLDYGWTFMFFCKLMLEWHRVERNNLYNECGL